MPESHSKTTNQQVSAPENKAAVERFLLDPIFHARVYGLTDMVLDVMDLADRIHAADVALEHTRTLREVRRDQLLLALCRWANEDDDR